MRRSAFRHPRRHALILNTFRSDGRFAYAAISRKNDTQDMNDYGEVKGFFDPENDHGSWTEFYLRKAAGRWRIMYWIGPLWEGAPEGGGFVFDYRPLRPTGFPARLDPESLRGAWATKLIYTKKGTKETRVMDVAKLDRNRVTRRFMLDGHRVIRVGLNRP